MLAALRLLWATDRSDRQRSVVEGAQHTPELSDSESRIDLHLHSNRSDGQLDPAAVMAAAGKAGLKAVALTDHDTVAGLGEARRAADAAGLSFVPGIEFSCYDQRGSTHLLGYFIDPDDPALASELEAAREGRLQRAGEMVERLRGLGVEISLDEVVAQASAQGAIARPHVARALVAGGWVRHYGEAFERFIAAGGPAYVPTRRIDPAEGIRRIHAAGGLAVLAHGGKTHGKRAIRELAQHGLDGLETLHPDHGLVEVRKLRGLARELELLETGGSDWHGHAEGRRVGLGSLPVPIEWYLRLRDAAERARPRA